MNGNIIMNRLSASSILQSVLIHLKKPFSECHCNDDWDHSFLRLWLGHIHQLVFHWIVHIHWIPPSPLSISELALERLVVSHALKEVQKREGTYRRENHRSLIFLDFPASRVGPAKLTGKSSDREPSGIGKATAATVTIRRATLLQGDCSSANKGTTHPAMVYMRAFYQTFILL